MGSALIGSSWNPVASEKSGVVSWMLQTRVTVTSEPQSIARYVMKPYTFSQLLAELPDELKPHE